MSFDVFNKEKEILDTAKAVLEEGRIPKSAIAEYTVLLKAYEKLFKSSKRLVRLSDRNEAELSKTAKSLDEKNVMLEQLSGKLGKYLSPQIFESIFSGKQDAELKTERKKLTVFFSDIKDFTSTTADLQPEDLTYLLNKYFSEMSKIALEYGATIDKFIGDAMLLFFGDPESKGVPEDARACVGMAIAMQRRMEDLGEVWRAKGFEKPFKMRIGICTGYCNVGNFGSDDRMDYTIIGGEVNLAARLESAADPGGILMAYETYALVKDMVEAEERDKITMKGIRREVHAYAVTNILDGFEKDRRVVHHENVGLYLHMDIDRLKGKARTEAKRNLTIALDKLSE